MIPAPVEVARNINIAMEHKAWRRKCNIHAEKKKPANHTDLQVFFSVKPEIISWLLQEEPYPE